MISDPSQKITKDELKSYLKNHFKKNNEWFNEEEFNDAFDEIFVTKKMINRFLSSDQVNEKLIINKIVLILNSFGISRTNEIFRLCCDNVQFSVSKAVLMFLRQYDFKHGNDVDPNRIMVDILKNMQERYNLEHMK